jgi:hypothetical protein
MGTYTIGEHIREDFRPAAILSVTEVARVLGCSKARPLRLPAMRWPLRQKLPADWSLCHCPTSCGDNTTMIPEPFVSADEAARFLSVKRRYLLVLARSGIAGAYALGTGCKRKLWVFRLSELAAAIARKGTPTPIPKSAETDIIRSGSPR